MKPWTKLIAIGAVALLGACASLPGGGGREAPPREAVVLPEDYRQALDLMARGEHRAAEAALRAYAARNPGQSSPLVNLALLYRQTERHDQAREALQQALAVNPQQPAAHNLLGIYAREAGDFESAREAYQAALKADAAYPNAHLNLAILMDLYLHQPAAALRHYKRYEELIGEEALDQEVKSWIADTERQAQGGR